MLYCPPTQHESLVEGGGEGVENDEWMERQDEGNEERNGGALPTRKSQKPKVAIAPVLRILHYKHTAFHRTFARVMHRAAIAGHWSAPT